MRGCGCPQITICALCLICYLRQTTRRSIFLYFIRKFVYGFVVIVELGLTPFGVVARFSIDKHYEALHVNMPNRGIWPYGDSGCHHAACYTISGRCVRMRVWVCNERKKVCQAILPAAPGVVPPAHPPMGDGFTGDGTRRAFYGKICASEIDKDCQMKKSKSPIAIQDGASARATRSIKSYMSE